MMLDWIRAFGQGGEWVPLVVAFVALPGLYMFLAIDVHKDYTELIKSRVSAGEHMRGLPVADLLMRVREQLYIFELEWWVVAATGVLLFAIASLSDLFQYSNLLSICRIPTSCQSTGCIPKPSDDCLRFLSILRLYCVSVGLLLSFRIAWARIAAAKELKVLYAKCAKG